MLFTQRAKVIVLTMTVWKELLFISVLFKKRMLWPIKVSFFLILRSKLFSGWTQVVST